MKLCERFSFTASNGSKPRSMSEICSAMLMMVSSMTNVPVTSSGRPPSVLPESVSTSSLPSFLR